MADEHPEGWYTDPFGRHEARWIITRRPAVERGGRQIDSGQDAGHADPGVLLAQAMVPPPATVGSAHLQGSGLSADGSGGKLAVIGVQCGCSPPAKQAAYHRVSAGPRSVICGLCGGGVQAFGE